jgi:hypothetical protein
VTLLLSLCQREVFVVILLLVWLNKTMKVTSNLSFLLCISSVVMPAIDARTNGFGQKRSAAAKRSIQRQEVFDFAAKRESYRDLKSPVPESSINVHQQRRSLQTDVDLALEELCEAIIELFYGPDSSCTCQDNGEPASDCDEFQFDQFDCKVCDNIQGQRACLAVAADETVDASSADVEAACFTYESGPFDNTICTLDNIADDTCTFTIDGVECNSCARVACSATDGAGVFDESYDFDCSNVIEGETWNLCTGNLPETSRFLALGNNDRFIDLDCGAGGSGAFALSFHYLSVVVGLIVVASTFW